MKGRAYAALNDFLAPAPDREDHGQAGHGGPFAAQVERFKGKRGGIEAQGRVADDQRGVGFAQHGREVRGAGDQTRLDAKLLRQNHARQHHRSARRRIDRERLDPGHRNLGDQQNAAHRAVAGNPRAAEIFQLLARHLDHRDDADVGCAGGKLGRAIRGQGEAQIESLAELGVRGMLDAPNQRYGIEVADRADARPGDGMIRMQLFSVATGRHEV